MSSFSNFDEQCMLQAVELAGQGQNPSPNPRVGAVIAYKGQIIASGFHRGPGFPHAEIEALQHLKSLEEQFVSKKKYPRSQLTLYTTLEPCCHTDKRTPPCIDAIIQSKIQQVVVGALDPNPQVHGQGLKALTKQEIQVRVGCLDRECNNLIRFYAYWQKTKRPYLILKSALSLDGKIALANGESRWLTSLTARKKVHELRSQVDAILIGGQTARVDNPELTVRHVKGKNPLRLVLSASLKLPLDLKLWRQEAAQTLLMTGFDQSKNPKLKALQKLGVEVLFCKNESSGKLSWDELLPLLGERGLQSIMIEGGGQLFSDLIQQQLIQEYWLFLAPQFLGGGAIDLLPHYSLSSLKEASPLAFHEVVHLGEDLWLTLRSS